MSLLKIKDHHRLILPKRRYTDFYESRESNKVVIYELVHGGIKVYEDGAGHV